MFTGTRRWKPAKHRGGPIHIDGEDHGPEYWTEGNNDGPCPKDNILYRWYWRLGSIDGKEKIRASRDRLRPTEIEPYAEDDMPRFRKRGGKLLYISLLLVLITWQKHPEATFIVLFSVDHLSPWLCLTHWLSMFCVILISETKRWNLT